MKILDCTLRDGGYLNDWNFSLEFGRDLYRVLSKIGIDYVELGFVYDEGNLYKSLNSDMVNELVVGVEDGAKTCVMMDFGKCEFNLARRDHTNIDMVRVAAHKKDIYDAIDLCKRIQDYGYQSSLQMMNFLCYSIPEIRSVCQKASDANIRYLYVADSFGGMHPSDVRRGLNEIMEGGVDAGFHAHDNISQAFENSLTARECGASIVDGTVLGIGRGAGNLKLEQFIAKINMERRKVFDVGLLFDFIEKHEVEFAKCGRQHRCEYMISGLFNIHPNVVGKMRKSGNSYSQIWNSLYND